MRSSVSQHVPGLRRGIRDIGAVAMAANLSPAVMDDRPGALNINDNAPVSFKSRNPGRFVCWKG